VQIKTSTVVNQFHH